MRELGDRPELEVSDFGHIELAGRLIAEGVIDAPAFFQSICGAGYPPGRMGMPMVAQAMLLGGDVRVGLEDNLYPSRGCSPPTPVSPSGPRRSRRA